MIDDNLKRSIIIDNYQNPKNRGIPDDELYIKVNSSSVSCIDNIDIYVKLNGEIIEDIKYEGEACVIAISSTSILSELIKGKTIAEAKVLIENYFKMIEEEEYDEQLLGEAIVYNDIYKQPSRKNCSTIFVRGINKIINGTK